MAVERFKTQVLILHPHQAVLDACRKVFRDDHYTLHLAQSGREALALLGETPIDYFVTTEELPGMTGSEALKEARRRSPETQGILIAARDSTADEIASLANSHEFAAVLQSSASPRELFEIVADAAKRRRLADLSESANDSDHVVDTSASSTRLPTPPSINDEELFVVDDEADITGARAALHSPMPPVGKASDAIAEILVLSRDEAFYHAINQAARGLRSVHRCPTLQEASDIMNLGRVGVLVTDAAVAPTEVQGITSRLRQIQPSLVTIVAGRRDDGDQLMGLISDGIVYRFLLKPVSPGRARLALEASVKKSLEYRDNPPPVPTPPRTSGTNTLRALRSTVIDTALDDDDRGGFGRWLPIAAALLVGLVAGSVWLLGGDSEPTPAAAVSEETTAEPAAEPAAEPIAEPAAQSSAVAPASALATPPQPEPAATTTTSAPTSDARELRRAAFRALAEGRVAQPDGNNALSLYAQAMQIDPYAEGLREEFDAAIADALTVTEAAITRGALNDAAATLARLREVQPYQARLPFLESQLRKERIQALVTQARTSATNGDTDGALAILERAESIAGSADPTVNAAREAIVAGNDSRELSQLLRLASARMASGSLIVPAEDNAAFYYRAALARDPNNAIARQGLALIGSSLVTDGDRALQRGDLDAAAAAVAAATALATNRTEVEQLRAAIDAARERRLAAAQAERARAAAEQSRRNAPPTETAAASPATTSPAAAKPRAAAAVSAPSAQPAPVALPPLERTRYVAPDYPRNAARRNVSGWAHLGFTVTASGEVANISVIDAEPDNTFVAAARKALAQWEFEPTIVDGVAIERESDIRINFSLSD